MGNVKVNIPFNGLSEGKHKFNFDIDSLFFNDFEYGEIKKGTAQIEVLLNKSSRVMVVDVVIKGHVEVQCDKCLDMFDLSVITKDRLYVQIGEYTDEENDELMILSQNDNEIDLTHFIYESIHLSLPYRKIHPKNKNGESGCNTKMIEKLNEHKNESKSSDPRWDKLKDLM